MYTHHYAQQQQQQQQQPPNQQQSMSGSSLSNTSSVSPAPMMTMGQNTQMMNPSFFQHPQYPQSQYHAQMAQNIAFDPTTMTYQPINKGVMAQYPMNIQQTPLGHPPPPPPAPHGQLPPQHSTVYSFVVPTQQHKRPRRRYEEIERIYQCNWEDCTKAYGTLNHLNAHVTMQKHGPKRTPEEFKEIRRLYKEKKKSEDAVRKKAAEEAQHAMGQVMPPVGHSHGSSQPGLWNNTPNSAIQMAHANTTPSSNGNGIMEHAYASNIYNMKDENYMEYFNGRNATNGNSSTSTGNVHSSNSSTSSMSHGSTVMSQSPSYNGVSSPMAPSMSMGLSSVSMSKTDSVEFNPMSFEMMSQSSLGSTVNSNNMQPSSTNSGASTGYAMNYNTMVASPSTISPASQSYPYMYDEKR